MIQKAFNLLGIADNKKAKEILSRMIAYKKEGKETLFLAHLESLCEALSVDKLGKDKAIDFREKINFISETIVEGKPAELTLYEQYFHTPEISDVKPIDKSFWKFKAPEIDTSEILEIKKENYRFENDGIYGGLSRQ